MPTDRDNLALHRDKLILNQQLYKKNSRFDHHSYRHSQTGRGDIIEAARHHQTGEPTDPVLFYTSIEVSDGPLAGASTDRPQGAHARGGATLVTNQSID